MSNPILRAFGSHLRNLRLQKGFSQEKLAELAGLHRTYIGSLERGSRNPTILTLVKITDALEVTLPELLDFVADSHTQELR